MWFKKEKYLNTSAMGPEIHEVILSENSELFMQWCTKIIIEEINGEAMEFNSLKEIIEILKKHKGE